MATVQFSAVLVCCAYFLSSSSALDPNQLELMTHHEHLAYIADFPCLHPQPKVIFVHKLFSWSQSHGKDYFPHLTALHRCDECTGSCPPGYTCTPKTSHSVIFPFRVVYLEEQGKFKKGDWQMEYHQVLNHTECACGVTPHHDYRGKSDERPPMSAPPTPSQGFYRSVSGPY